MALKNYIAPEVVVSISHIAYDKNARRCTANIDIWSDQNKTDLIGTTGVTLEGGHLAHQVESVKNLRKVPILDLTDEQKSMFFLLPEDAGKEWFAPPRIELPDDVDPLAFELPQKINTKNHIAKYDDRLKTWAVFPLENIWVVHAYDEGKYYKWAGSDWVPHDEMSSDKRLWDKWMAPEIAMAEGTNPIKQMYLFLKTLPKFKNCIDC
jgi:hypothetical protein